MTQLPVTDWYPPEDPIFGLMATFRKDSRANKVNLGIGAYRTSAGEPLVLSCVRHAEQFLFDKKLNKEYLPIDGDIEFCRLISGLIFGPLLEEVQSRTYVAQMVGGTGALRIGGEYIALGGKRKIFLSVPTWPNHKNVFGRAGLEVENYPYFDQMRHHIDFAAMCQSISKMPPGSVLMLHACCHNPTGVDLSMDQWKQVSKVAKEHQLLPFFDMAYQGFGEGLDVDAQAVRLFVEDGHDLLIAYSCAKNFGLYNERVGLLAAVTKSASSADLLGRQVKTVIRANYSNPPAHGARIVSTILQSEELKKEWFHELDSMRKRIEDMRRALVGGLQTNGHAHHFNGLINQKGLFSYGILNSDQVNRLRQQFAIYIPDDGRINVAGLSPENLPYVLEAIEAVSATNV